MAKKSSILIIYTGGTIGMRTDPHTGVLVPFDFSNIYEEFTNLKYLDVGIEVMSFEPIDSSNVKPDMWVRLASIIRDRYDEFDGFVILHGTDTMSYSASALSFMLEDQDKPVIFTGSQIPIGVMRTDGRENLITAIEIAAARINGEPAVPEVGLYFQNRLFRANRTTKYSAEELDAFRSDNYPALADVGVNIHYNTNYIRRPNGKGKLKVHTDLESRIIVVKLFPGLTEGIFTAMIDIEGVRGVVLETYGSGNAPTEKWFLDVLSSAISRGIPVINVTQCLSGSVMMDMYETGIHMRDIGVISGRDITTEAAVAKMMYLLGRGFGGRELKAGMECSLRGEIS